MVANNDKYGHNSHTDQQKQLIADITKQLRNVGQAQLGEDIISLKLVSTIRINADIAYFAIKADADKLQQFELIRTEAANRVMAVDGISKAIVTLTDQLSDTSASHSKSREHISLDPVKSDIGIGKIKNIIAVASGKGGVGKSTTAVNLAAAFNQRGLKVGVLDADVYGPSLPKLLGKNEKPQTADNNSIIPIKAGNMKLMSIGFMIDEDAPVIWRGPMIISALKKMLSQTCWGELDVLVIDMPPGTGDAPLTLAKTAPLSGVIIVSTPQDLALIDARKGINMFIKLDVPVLGIIENMSYFICPQCNSRSHPFGHDGARTEAEKLNVNFLGALPLDIRLREKSDTGQPLTSLDPAGEIAAKYLDIANKIIAMLDQGKTAKQQNRT